MTIYEQVEGIIMDGRMALDEKLQYQKSSVMDNPINVSNYSMDLKVAMITILRLGVFQKETASFLLPHIDQCVRGYIDTYIRMLTGEKFYITVLEDGLVKHDNPIPILH